MCGFAAIVGTDNQAPDPLVLRRMIESLVHRGPDDSGTFVEGGHALGFRRLAILDLAPSGHQPMTSPDGRHVIVFNGEIYNYIELRAELEQLGHTFRSSGDTEVLLAAYRQWGRDCLPRLNGMWAFLILDRQRRTLFGSRDRFGVKPLFVHRGPRWTLLASEIKAIRDSGLAACAVNWHAVSRWLLESRMDDTSETFYEGIEQIPAGSAFEIDANGTLRSWRYWQIENDVCPPAADIPAQFAELFENAVKLRLRSDVPVGVLLSGGLDSTSIICSMARQRDAAHAGPLRAFCYMSREYDETPYIEATLAQTGAELHRLTCTPQELWNDLPRHLWFHDQPAHSATSVIGFKLMELARRNGVKVLLNGQGADETLAGYPSYFHDRWRSLLSRGRCATAYREICRFQATHGGSVRDLFLRAVQAAFQAGLQGVSIYRQASANRRARRLASDPWFRGPVMDAVTSEPRKREPHALNAVLRRSVEVAPLPLYLRVEDRNSMAHSLEARLPFLDYRLVSLAFRLGDEWKLRAPWNKYVLRESMRGRIPENVRTRPDKFGFPSPVDLWIRGPWYDGVRELIESSVLRRAEICDLARVRTDLERHKRGEIAIGARLFDLAQLAIWLGSCERTSVALAA